MSEDSGKRDSSGRGLSRRAFIGTVGAGTIGAAVAGTAAPAQAAPPAQTDGLEPLELMINGRKVALRVEPRWTLLDVLRDNRRGECGACTVLVDGLPRYACMTLALEAEGSDVATVEGLMQGEDLGTVQQSFADEDAFQCGYCTPGQVCAAEGLLKGNPNPTPAEIQEGMSGNLCRCGTYDHIFKAVRRAAEVRSSG
jgi:xanthine dehydrogenase YagT iron-sulfur-binding subunit